MAEEFLTSNDELLDVIHANMRQVEFQHYNLEVYLAIAQLFRQNLHMLRDLNEISNEVDDAKDHLPVRTVDMTYLIYRQLLYPMEDWAQKTLAVRNQYAKANHLFLREFRLDWKNTAKPAAEVMGQ
jgi:hypothetical protein